MVRRVYFLWILRDFSKTQRAQQDGGDVSGFLQTLVPLVANDRASGLRSDVSIIGTLIVATPGERPLHGGVRGAAPVAATAAVVFTGRGLTGGVIPDVGALVVVVG